MIRKQIRTSVGAYDRDIVDFSRKWRYRLVLNRLSNRRARPLLNLVIDRKQAMCWFLLRHATWCRWRQIPRRDRAIDLDVCERR